MSAPDSRRVLSGLTLLEVLTLVGVLAGYLVAVNATLRRISTTLGKVTFGVRAIERQTEPVGAGLGAVADNLTAVARSLSGS